MRLLCVVMVWFAAGCCSTAKTPTPLETAKGVCSKAAKVCNTYSCGGNSAVVNAFPVNGWRSGECSYEGIQVIKASLDGACAGQTLDIKNGRLVGLNSDGSEGCVEAGLKGTSFEIGGYKKDTERIKITDVKVDWEAPNHTKRTAYQMEWEKNKYGLCSRDGQKLRKELGIETLYDTDDLPDAKAQLVIPLVGEVYGEQGEIVHKDNWNHFACVDDALAKRSLYNLEDPKDLKKNHAALRMLTADYCGAMAWTVRGEWIEWGHANSLNVEAQWDEDGAKCLTAPRLLRDDNDQPVLPADSQHFKRLCKKFPNGCKTVDDWMTAMKTCRKMNGDPIKELKPCEECTDPLKCPLSSKNAKHP